MAFSSTIRLVFTGDSTGAERAAKRTEDSLDRLNATGKRAFGGLGDSANLLTGALGVGGLAYGLKSLNDAARESELSAVRMQTQFRALGLDFEQHRARVDDVIAAQSRLAALDDEELADSFTTILRVTGDVNRSLELNALAADIARGKQIDLASAGEIVAKVAGGNTGILARYGIQIEKGATATEALGELQRLFAGQAEAYGKSNAGAADRASVAWENAREALGEKLLPVISRLATFLSDDLIPAVTMFAGGIDTVVDALGGWKIAAAFILTGLLATRLLGIVTAVRAYTTATATATVATTALGTASTLATGGALAGLTRVARFARFGLVGALALGAYEMRRPIGDFVDWMTGKLEGVLGWIPGYSVKKADEAAKAVELRSKELMPLAGQTAGGLFYTGWHEKFRISLRTGKMTLRKDIAEPLSEVGELAGADAGEDTAKAYTLSLAAFLRVKFPPAVIGALAPTWDDIKKAAEAAGIDVGSAFTSGFQQTAATTNGQFGPNTLNSYATSQGAQGASVANAVNYALSQQGVPYVWGGGRSGGPDAGAGLGVDKGQRGFDCSGLIYAAYKRAGVEVPGTSQAWLKWPHKVGSIADLMPGDVIVTNGGEHAVMYIGNGMVIAASGGPSGGGNDKVLIQSLDYHRSGIVGMFRPVPGAQVSAGAIDDVVASTVPGSEPRPSIPSSTTSSPTSTTPQAPQPRTSFPGIAGISDRLQERFDEANQQEGEALRYDPETKKWVAVKVGPDMKALKRLADHLRTKVLPGIQKRIDVLKKRIGRLVKKKADATLISTLRNKLKALQAERDEVADLWAEVIDTWKDLKAAAEDDDDVDSEPPTEAWDSSGPVGEPVVVGLPGHGPEDAPDAPAAPDAGPDVQAQLEQANRRAASATWAAQIAAGFVQSVGIGVDANGNTTVTPPSGAPTVIVQSLQLPSQEWLAELIGQVSQGAAVQAAVPASTVQLGV